MQHPACFIAAQHGQHNDTNSTTFFVLPGKGLFAPAAALRPLFFGPLVSTQQTLLRNTLNISWGGRQSAREGIARLARPKAQWLHLQRICMEFPEREKGSARGREHEGFVGACSQPASLTRGTGHLSTNGSTRQVRLEEKKEGSRLNKTVFGAARASRPRQPVGV